jgi:hypothetical protein
VIVPGKSTFVLAGIAILMGAGYAWRRTAKPLA